jgi:hypothetical protein
MDFFEFLRERSRAPDIQDELIYEFIAAELSQQKVKQGLWTKALSDAEWNEAKAKSSYVRMRYEQIKSEIQDKLRQLQEEKSPDRLARKAAREAGLSQVDIDHLGTPILAITYLKKYGVSKDRLAIACTKKAIPAVMHYGILWVSDRPLEKSSWLWG